MRFSRDRRGYEHTYVLHTSRGQGRQEPRILYWFRTPPHVRVGRAAIDEEAIRLLEGAHPDVQFEWSRMLKAQPPPAPLPEDHGGRRRRDRNRQDRGRPQAPVREQAAAIAEPEERPADPAAEPDVQPELEVEPEPLEPDFIEVGARSELLEPPEPRELREPSESLEPLEPQELSEPSEPREPRGQTALLDPAVLERLRTRHAELLTRINQRMADAVQRDVLRAEAERLNPETWVTPDEARTGLEHFERWFEAIRAQLPQPARRRRRGRRRGGGGREV